MFGVADEVTRLKLNRAALVSGMYEPPDVGCYSVGMD